MRETVSGRRLDGWRGILYIFILFAGIMISVFLTNAVSVYVGAAANYVLVLMLVVLGWLIVKYNVTEFMYEIDGETLRIWRLLGKREKLMETINLRGVNGFSVNDGKGVQKKTKYAFVSYGQCLCSTYHSGENTHNTYISPTDGFRDELMRRAEEDVPEEENDAES